MTEKLSEILDSLKKIKGVIGIAVYSIFGGIKYSNLPDWVDPKNLVGHINQILGSSNKAIKELKEGDFTKTIIETSKGFVIISMFGKDFICIITRKDTDIKWLELGPMNKILEDKRD